MGIHWKKTVYFDENDPVNSYDPLYVDAVVSNPPYSQAWDQVIKKQILVMPDLG